MAKGKTGRPSGGSEDRTLQVTQGEAESSGRVLARAAIGPVIRHTVLAEQFATPIFGKGNQPPITETTEVIREHLGDVGKGDLTIVSRLLAAQAISLDAVFTDLAERAGRNRGEYLNAAEIYMRLALKAQSACRATVEALAKLHQPREQIVKHVHVNEGGQAVVADQFHQHAGGEKNEKAREQPHATGAAGTSPALPGPDPLGNGMPIPSREGAQAVPNARRQAKRGA